MITGMKNTFFHPWRSARVTTSLQDVHKSIRQKKEGSDGAICSRAAWVRGASTKHLHSHLSATQRRGYGGGYCPPIAEITSAGVGSFKERRKKEGNGTKETEEQTSPGFQLLRSSNKTLNSLFCPVPLQHRHWKANRWFHTVQHLPARSSPAPMSQPGFGPLLLDLMGGGWLLLPEPSAAPDALRVSQERPRIPRPAGCWMAHTPQTAPASPILVSLVWHALRRPKHLFMDTEDNDSWLKFLAWEGFYVETSIFFPLF